MYPITWNGTHYFVLKAKPISHLHRAERSDQIPGLLLVCLDIIVHKVEVNVPLTNFKVILEALNLIFLKLIKI